MLLKIVVNAVYGAQGSISCIEPLGSDLQGKGQGSTKDHHGLTEHVLDGPSILRWVPYNENLQTGKHSHA